MANSCKFYQDGNDILVETNSGNLIMKDDGFYDTTRTGNTLTEIPCDITVQAKWQNAVNAMTGKKSLDFVLGFGIVIAEKIEDFDGPEN